MSFVTGCLVGGSLVYALAKWVIRGRDEELQASRDRCGMLVLMRRILERELADAKVQQNHIRASTRDNIERIIDETRYPT